jgi:hypothetical protein
MPLSSFTLLHAADAAFAAFARIHTPQVLPKASIFYAGFDFQVSSYRALFSYFAAEFRHATLISRRHASAMPAPPATAFRAATLPLMPLMPLLILFHDSH